MKKNLILLSAVASILAINFLMIHWHKEREIRISNAIFNRVPECCPTDANIQKAIDEVVELFDLTEKKRHALYMEYYVGGGNDANVTTLN